MNQPSFQAWTDKELEEIKQKFNQLSSIQFEGAIVHKKVKILQVDASLAAIFGYQPDELTDLTLLELSTPESRELVLKNTLLEIEEPYKVIGLHKNDTTFPIELFSKSIAYKNDAIRVMGVRRAVENEPEEILATLQQAHQNQHSVIQPGTTSQLRYSNELLRLELDERLQMETQLRDRARQQAAVAELGQRALVGTNLDLLMDEAVSQVAQTLRVEFAKIQEVLADIEGLQIRAGFGWQDGVVGQAVAGANAESQAGFTLLSSGPIIVEDFSKEARFKPSLVLQQHQVASGVSVIIYGRDNPFGVLSAHTTQIRMFTEDDMHFLQAVANVLATAIENIRLQVETQRRAEQLAVLHELDRAITTSLRLSDIYHAFTQHAIRLLPYTRTSVTLLEDDQLRVSYMFDKEKKEVLSVDTMIPREGSAVGWVLTEGQPLLRHNIPADVRYFEDSDLVAGNICSCMIIPLRVKGQVIGTWNIGSEQVGAYTPDHLDIAQSMADQLAMAIENARLFQQAKQEIAERQRAEAELARERAMLAERVAERTVDLMAANEELARAARLKDEFLASMSHELRTPLTAVLGMAEVLKMEAYGPLTEKQVKSLNVIDESGRHLLALINDILDLSKIEADKLDLEVEPVSVSMVCRSSLQFVKQAAAKKDIDVSFDYDDAVSVLQADERRFKQILVNLLSNAVKFTPDGGEVGLQVTGDSKQDMAHFVVWDTGIGIEPEDLDRLFLPFVQLDSKLARQYSGTGLGLALVNRMTKMHGGTIAVESSPGQGSRFTVSFPWTRPILTSDKTATPVLTSDKLADQEEDTVDISVTKQPTAQESSAKNASDQTSGALVLLAEDEYTTTLLVTDFLHLIGYRVITAENGFEALEQVQTQQPDIVLMDIQMPEMDGLEAIKQVRANTNIAGIPIVALTALAMPGDKEKCLAAGANDYLSKPIDLQELAKVIDKHIELSNR